MLKIFQIDRKVDVNTGETSNETCQLVLAIGDGDVIAVNKTRFYLKPDEAARLEELTRSIEERIAGEVLSVPSRTEPAPATLSDVRAQSYGGTA